MTTINIFCAGAAQAVVSQLAAKFQRESGNLMHAEYGAVGAMQARVVSGVPADVVVLTSALVDELIAGGARGGRLAR
jgi:molybdate transport system substrate-binding protein